MNAARPGRRIVLASAALTLVVAGAQTAAAQVRSFTNYTGREGLPQAQVLALHQDRQSFLWIGTYGGLTRFDGREFRTFTRRDGLSSNSIRAIGEDGQGRLVVGTVGGGVCVREITGFRCVGSAEGLPDPDVSAVLPDPDGGFWAATEAGIVRVARDYSVTAYGEAEGLPGPVVSRLERDRNGRLWAATNEGLASLEGDRFVAHPAAALRGTPITILLGLHDGLLVGTADRLFVHRQDTLDAMPVRDALRLSDAARDPKGEIWIATAGGVLRLSAGGVDLLTRDHGLLDDIVNTVIVDREGNVWFGSESGLSKLTPGPFSQFTVGEGLPNPFVRALSTDGQGRLWAGTRDGVAVHEGGRFREIPLPGIPDRRVYALAPLPDGGMLIGTRQGLVHYDGGLRRLYLQRDGLPNDFVSSLLPDGVGGVWVGTAGGLTYWSGGRLREAGGSMPDVFVTSLATDRRGRLWIGCRAGGVIVVDDGRQTTFGAADGLSDQTIWGLGEDDAGAMWVGTNGDGVFRIGPDGGIRAYTEDDGLANDFVWQVLPDRRGGVWLFTSHGLDRYTDGRFNHYGRDDGLLELEGSASAIWQDARDDIWFGTGNGLIHYRAALDVPHTLPPPVYVEAVTVDGLAIDRSDPRIPAGDGTLRIQFTSPTFGDVAAVRFRHRLGDGDDWSPLTNDRTVTLARLEPGQYQFQVEAINGDDVASTTPATFAFTVLPAFWQTGWFRGLALLALLGLTATLPWLRSRHLRRDHQRLGRLVAENTRALAEHNQRLEREVADRQAAEAALRENQERLRDILAHSTNLFYSLTPDLAFTYLSPQVAQFFGREGAEAPAHLHEVLTDHPQNAEGLNATRRAAATGQWQPPHEAEIRGPAGETRWVVANEAPVVRDGRTVAIVGSLTDITESKRARASEQRLEDQLRHAQKMEAVGQLAGGIAHDFNNLLTAIVCHTEFASEAVAPDSPAGADLAEVRRAAGRATSLVSQLLTFSRQQLVKRRTLDLNVVAAEAARMLTRVLGSDIELRLELAPDAAWVLGDQGQLDQILLNLALNARDAMPTGGRLTISIRDAGPSDDRAADVPAGRRLVLDVADTGHGIDPAIKDRLFDPFFTTKGVGKGTGLGLATVYGIVEQNGWQITVDSGPGRGARFRIDLPVASPPQPAAVAAADAAASGPAAEDHVVLVAEDQESVRKLVCQTLARKGYRVLSAAAGPSAVELSRQTGGRIDLLLSDMIMPGLNGRQVAHQITEQRPGIRVLFMSGHADGVLGRNGLIEEEHTQLIRKPFTPTELAQRVDEVLSAALPR
jgi:PAS domain S-box-containing protein